MKRKITYINGIRLKRSIIASAKRVTEMQDHLNNINVFPVPDGDTGTNMATTMNSIAEGAAACDASTVESVSNAIADSALTGSRGNSGAILAQFFQGLAEATRGKVRLTTKTFADAAENAVNRARSAISNPREGTIITVMKDWANHLSEHAPHTQDFADLLKVSLSKAKESLADTPNKLKILKKAGVVDAGAEGFVHLLEGIVDYLDAGKIAALKAGTHVVDRIKNFHLDKADTEFKFRFCTECLLEGSNLDTELVRKELASMGDSLIVVGSAHKLRVHIHTNEPENIFKIAGTHGTLIKTKIDDMRRQHEDALRKEKKGGIALVTDSTCDLPKEIIEKYGIHVVPVMLLVGNESYRDRVEITTQDFYRILETTNQKLSTSQPSAAAFKKIYDLIAPEYDSVISIHLAEKLSGTLQGARIGSRGNEFSDRIHIIDSKTTSASLGLLVSEAAKLIEQNLSVDEIVSRIETSVKNTRLFVSIPTLKYVMRSGRLNRTKGILGTILNLKPVISIGPDGGIIELAKVLGQKRVFRKTLKLAIEYARSVKNPRFSVVHVLAPDKAEWYRDELHKIFNNAEIPIMDASPALGVHAGPGSAAIAILGDRA